MGSIWLLLVLLVMAVAAPLVSAWVLHTTPAQQNLSNTFLGPNRTNWLGTDELGRDSLARLMYGARVSLGVAGLTVALTILVASLVGLIAGFYGGVTDELLMRLVDGLLAIPPLYVFILMSILFHPKMFMLAVIIASVMWAGVARLVRGEVRKLRSRDYVLAAHSIGATETRIMLRHLLPNVLPLLIVASSLAIAQTILVEAALDFLGLGVQPPTPSWGNMLSNSQNYYYHSAWLVILPGAAILLSVLATTVVGNGLRDAFDPRTS
jgi:peptide/nickel transport system permease protein